MINIHNGSSGFPWQNGGITHPSILHKNVPVSSTLWISSSIYYITLKGEYKGSSSGGPHREPTRGPQTIEGKLGYAIIFGC